MGVHIDKAGQYGRSSILFHPTFRVFLFERMKLPNFTYYAVLDMNGFALKDATAIPCDDPIRFKYHFYPPTPDKPEKIRELPKPLPQYSRIIEANPHLATARNGSRHFLTRHPDFDYSVFVLASQ